MTTFDLSLLPDIANAIGLQSPAFVEKDYYAIQLLKIICVTKIPEGQFIFAGGTCLTKAHLPTFRMSEDIDIKFLPTDNFLKRSDSQKRKTRSNLGAYMQEKFENSKLFTVVDNESRNENRYRCFSISYPKTYTHNSLRPELKLEFTENTQEYFPSTEVSISSIYASTSKQTPEIPLIKCDHLNLIFVEKFVGLLRRIAESSRGYSEKEDEALVRHVYDLHLIYMSRINLINIQELLSKIIARDVNQFGMRHPEFKKNPTEELLYGLNQLITENIHRNRYNSFLGPLVYHSNPPSWEQGIESLKFLSKTLIHSLK